MHVTLHASLNTSQYGQAVHFRIRRHPGSVPGTGAISRTGSISHAGPVSRAGSISRSGSVSRAGSVSRPLIVSGYVSWRQAVHAPVIHSGIGRTGQIIPHIIQLTIPPNLLYFTIIICLMREVVTVICYLPKCLTLNFTPSSAAMASHCVISSSGITSTTVIVTSGIYFLHSLIKSNTE